LARFLFQQGRPAGGRAQIERGMVSPSTWTFYFDFIDRSGRKHRGEFDVIEDRGPISGEELARRIKFTIDTIKNRRILPFGAMPGRFGVYRGFDSLRRARWFGHRGLVDYSLDRHYQRGFGGRASAG